MSYNSDYKIVDGILLAYEGIDPEISIPREVSVIASSAFLKKRFIKSVVFPSSLREIGEKAFMGCSSLKSVSFGEGLKRINQKAFFACDLDNITIPDSVNYIGKSAFTSPPNRNLIIICNKNSVADNFARDNGFLARYTSFQNNRSEDNILWEPWQCTFSYDEKIVIIPEGIESITSCFSHDLEIEEVFLPDSVRYIGREAFSRCYNLNKVRFSNNLVSIGIQAFESCSLVEVVLPDSLETIDDYAFQYCGAIKRIILSKRLKRIGSHAFSGGDVNKLVLPTGLKYIGEWAFYGFRSVESIDFPDSLEYVGPMAFSTCTNLKTIRIPGMGITLGEGVFDCLENTKVFINHDSPGITTKSFSKVKGITIISEDTNLLKKLSGIDNVELFLDLKTVIILILSI